MTSHQPFQPETGLDYLLGLHGEVQGQDEEGYYIQFEVIVVKASPERPHGIKYSLTLHDPYGKRLMGFDNAHGGVKPAGSKFEHAGKHYPFDHRHRHASDTGIAYEFDTAFALLSDFYTEVDRILSELLP
jgi:hypothetical protein